jgi:hypothetical protein
MAGGDLRAALDKDARRELVWGRKGQQVALDIARGIHFLHSHDVRVLPPAPLGSNRAAGRPRQLRTQAAAWDWGPSLRTATRRRHTVLALVT